MSQFIHVSLMSGIASSAIDPILDHDDADGWLAWHGWEQLAHKAEELRNARGAPGDFLPLAERLDELMRGENANPKIGDEVVQLLQSLDISLVLESAWARGTKEAQEKALDLFQEELSKLAQPQPQNYYIHNHTLKTIATQSFYLSLSADRQDEAVFQRLTAIEAKMDEVSSRTVNIYTDGGAVIVGNVSAGRDVIGRDLNLMASKC
jgi:hypothetical protein